MQLKNKLKPELRFRGFKENWESKRLGDIGSSHIGLTYSPNDIAEDGRGTLVLRSSNIQNDNIAFEDNVYVKGTISSKNYVHENDILICARNGSRSLIGKSILIKKDQEGYAFGAFMSIYRSDYNNFIIHFFRTQLFNRQMQQHLGATINQLTSESISNIKLHLPTVKEQKKIALFLTSVDMKIQQISEKLRLLERYKKVVMRKLFKQEARFKTDKKNYPKWLNKPLNELLYEAKVRNFDMKYDKEKVLSVSGEYGIVNQIEHLGRSYAGESVANYHVVEMNIPE